MNDFKITGESDLTRFNWLHILLKNTCYMQQQKLTWLPPSNKQRWVFHH